MIAIDQVALRKSGMHVHDVIRNGLSLVDRSARHVKVPPIDRRLLADLTADTLLQIGNEFLNEFLTENLRLMPPILNELLIVPDTIAHTSSPAPTARMQLCGGLIIA